MKAIRFHQVGGPEVLRYEDVPLGEPGPGEVRIRHSAVALNFRDILVRRGQHSAKLPSGLGTESAGVVEAVGAGVSERGLARFVIEFTRIGNGEANAVDGIVADIDRLVKDGAEVGEVAACNGYGVGDLIAVDLGRHG